MPNKIGNSQAVRSAYLLSCESDTDYGEGKDDEAERQKRCQMREDRKLMNEIWTDLKRKVIKSANQLIEDPENKLTLKDLGLLLEEGTELSTENDEAYFLFKIDQLIRNHKKKCEESAAKTTTGRGNEKTCERNENNSSVPSKNKSEVMRKLEILEKDLAILRHFPIYWKTKKVGDDKVAVNLVPANIVQWVTKKSEKYPDKRPRATLEITCNSSGRLGSLVVSLYSDYLPDTCRNFLAFCHNKKNSLSYKHCPFTTIIPNLFCQTGDVTDFNGAGGATIYGKSMKDENFLLSHGEAGVLSMHNIGPNTNKSQFYITFRDVKSLDGCHVAFGKVIHGMDTLKLIERFGTKRNGVPTDLVYISNCYEV